MIHTDGKRTIAHRPVDPVEVACANEDAFRRTLDEIEALPTSNPWQDLYDEEAELDEYEGDER